MSLKMALECFDSVVKIADDRSMEDRNYLKNPTTKIYLAQIVKLLEIFYNATKQLESDGLANISKVIPLILNSLLELEDPQVKTHFIVCCMLHF
jgi:hypothetical protein